MAEQGSIESGVLLTAQSEQTRSLACTGSSTAYDRTCVGLALLLLVAALFKAFELVSYPAAWSRLVPGMALVWLELLFGVWLIFGSRGIWTWRVAVGCFSVFALAAAYKGVSGAESCGCFGRVRVSPWLMLGIDVMAVVVLLLHPPRATNSSRRPSWRFAAPVIACLLLLSSIAVGRQLQFTRLAQEVTQGGVIGDLVVLEPETWIGQDFPLIGHIETTAALDRGEWEVLLFRNDCHLCHDELRRLQHTAGLQSEQNVALICVDPVVTDDVANRLSGMGWALGTLDSSKTWFVTTPVRIHLKDGKCLGIKLRQA